MEDAGYSRNNMPCDRTGVILGNTLTGEHSRSQNMRLRWPYVKKVLKAAASKKQLPPQMIAELVETMEIYYKAAFAPITEDTLAGNLSNTIAGRICNFLDLRGGGYTVDGACSSSLIAVLTAATALSSGTLDVAVVGGIDISLDTFELIGFAKTNALTRGDMKVYDRRASGFIPGEGAGFVILKRLENARVHGNYIYAVLDGWGMSSDGKGGMTAPKAQTQALAIRRAYGKAGYGLRDVDFIEGHGTGTRAGDKAELEGIALAMDNEKGDFLRSCGITSLKSLIGHTKAASGIGGFIKAVMAVNRRVIPPTAGCKELNPVFHENAHKVYPVIQGEIRGADDSIRAGISSMGFGGINCHVTIESAGEPAKHLEPPIGERELLVSHQETELFVLSAESQHEMTDRVNDLKNLVDGISSGEMLDLSSYLTEDVSAEKPFRVALITTCLEGLIDCLERIEQILSTNHIPKGETMSSLQRDIWVGNSVLRSRVGFLFPGQGSQQLNMGRRMIERHSWARDFRDKVESWLSENQYKKISASIYRPLDRALNSDQIGGWKNVLSRAEIAQPAICMTSLLWMRYLDRLGIKPVVAGGHSLGELIAFHAAGAFDAKALLLFAAMRGRATSAPDGNPGMMASFACGKERVEELLKEIEGYAVVANINSPTQTVISGERPAVEKAIQLGLNLGIETKRLAISNAFHSRFMNDAADRILKHAPIPENLERTKIKLLTCMDGTEVMSGTNLRGHFAKQLTNQTDFISLVNSVTQECDVLLEVGPSHVLSKLVESITGTDGTLCFPIESSVGDDSSLNVFIGCYFVRGGDINWKALFGNRLVRPFIPASKRMFIDNPCERPFDISDEEISRSLLTVDTQPTVVPSLEPEDTSGPFTRQQMDFIRRLVQTETQKYTDKPKSYLERPMKEVPTIVSQFDNTTVEVSNGPAGGKEEKQEGSKQVPKTDVSIPDLLLDLVGKRTGFPRESLSMEARLLDDMNLDSIKAAELIAAASMRLGLAGGLDASKFANATLSEIADTLASLTKEKAGVERLFDTRLDSLVPSNMRNRWVRNFVVHYVHEPLSSTGNGHRDASWETSCVLIISDDSESAIATALQSELKGKGAQAQIVFFSEAPQGLEKGIVFTQYVTILPRIPDYGLSPAARLLTMVERLRTAVILESSVKTLTSNTTITYVQFGGGFFGTEMKHGDIEQCCAAAFAASVHHERPQLKVRVVDFSPLIGEAVIAQCLMHELSTPDRYSAVGYDSEMMRRVARPRIQEPSSSVQRSITWSSDDVVLVTGGAKGITAECAHAFARVTGVRMILVGSSPLPDNKPGSGSSSDIIRILERFSSEGLFCRYYSCDITDSNSLNLLIQRIRNEVGEITGVIHGAGLNRPNRTENVSAEEALKEIGPKLYGAMNLCNALKEIPPKLFVGFTSIIGVTGMPGNAWYAFSNEALDVVLRKFGRENPTSSVLCIAFSIWEEVGMGARLGSVQHLAKMGIGAIPTSEGVHRFLSLLLNNTETRQVIVTARLGGLDTWTPEHHTLPASRFLENIVTIEPNVEVVSRTHLSLQKHTYLKDHLWRGTYLFPTVFGLEAMAQAVSNVTGKNNFDALLVEDIRLEGPIAVSSEAGATIEIHAEVLEREAAAEPLRVSAGIRCDQTGFSTDHFSATFIFDNEIKPPLGEHIDIPERPLDIEPKRDLYGGLLFQGPLFQRIQKIYSLNSRKCVFLSNLHPDQTVFAEDKASSWLMGDPFFRDSLMQAPQLPLSRHICLPLRIERLERFGVGGRLPESLIGVTIIENHLEQEVTATVFIVDEGGYVVERLSGYLLKVIEYHDDYPTAEEIADPGKRDEEIICSEIGKRTREFDLTAPKISSAHVPGIHQSTKAERHKEELPLFQETCRRALKGSGYVIENVRITWLESGKPRIEGAAAPGLDISLSHDQGTVLCVAGSGIQGCDIASITNRTREEWIVLFGKAKDPLFQKLINGIDSHDRAGTRIWGAMEAVHKATTSFEVDLAIEKQQADTILFRCDLSDKSLFILTFPVALTRGPERMIALVCQSLNHQHSVSLNKQKKARGEHLGFDLESHKVDIVAGPQGRPLLSCQFPVTFKEASNPSRTLYFSHYFEWIGKLRELAIQPIYENLVESFSTGKWGMVTNHAETSIVGGAQSGDIIDGRAWLDRVSGKDRSKIDICFEWWKKTRDGKREQIAFSTMSTTWVAIRGHGIVEVQPLPEFAKEFLDKWLPPLNTQGGHYGVTEPVAAFDFGQDICREPAGPIRPTALLMERTFETTLEDANLVGNIYFSNYYLWQGRVRDHFINKITPEYFSGSGKQGELRCILCKVNHLNEAMPFERIGVRMYRTAIFERGVKLYFDYYRVDPHGKRKKLGYGEHEAIWFTPTGKNKWEPSSLPEAIRDALLPKEGADELEPLPRSWSTEKREI